MSRAWKPLVFPETGRVDRRAYTFCVLEAMRDHLRRRDVFVPASRRFADPRAQLLSGPGWESAGPQICRTLGLPLNAEPFVSDLGAELDVAYRRTAENLAGNASVDVERENGRERLRISPLDRLAEPGSLIALRQILASLMPTVDLPEVLLEVAAWTGFDTEFTHVAESAPRAEDLRTSICAVLLAEACNLGLEPVSRPDRPALNRGRLAWVGRTTSGPKPLQRPTTDLSTTKAVSLWRADGAPAKSPPPTACASLSPCAVCMPAPTPATSALAAASLTTTSAPTSSPDSPPSSSPAPYATPCSSSTGSWTTRPAWNPPKSLPTPPATPMSSSGSSGSSAISSPPAWPTLCRPLLAD